METIEKGTIEADKYLLAVAVAIAGDMFAPTIDRIPEKKKSLIAKEEVRIRTLLTNTITSLLNRHQVKFGHTTITGVIQDAMGELKWQFYRGNRWSPCRWVVKDWPEPLLNHSREAIENHYSMEETRIAMLMRSARFLYYIAHKVGSPTLAREAIGLDPSLKRMYLR